MCWEPEYIILIVISTIIDYVAALKMGEISERNKRNPYLYLSLFSNLGILFTFKYFNFFSDSVERIFNQFNIFYEVPYFDYLLPVGISFYTFQTLSYTIEVYYDRIKPEKHLGIFALYVSFFPQLVAGPIERPGNLLAQFYKKIKFQYNDIVCGLRLILWGLFKKVVIADRLAFYVNEVYNNTDSYSGFPVIIATYFFAFQIYCDFSGYSDIAIGSARVMGIRLMENFKQPYFAVSVRNFWQRWHISLSTWFRDYVYIPLGGNRVVKWRWHYNLFITFLVSGLWHGAKWTFVLWGALHGLYLIIPQIIKLKIQFRETKFINKFSNLLKILITFHLVVFAWIFFRANDMETAGTVILNLFDFSKSQSINVINNVKELALSFIFILLLLLVDFLIKNKSFENYIGQQRFIVRWTAYGAFIWALIFFGVFYTKQEFIYFQF